MVVVVVIIDFLVAQTAVLKHYRKFKALNFNLKNHLLPFLDSPTAVGMVEIVAAFNADYLIPAAKSTSLYCYS